MLGELYFYQIAVVLLAAAMIYSGIRKYWRHPRQSFFKISVRVVVWGGIAAIALFPKLTYSLAKFVGIESNVNAVILTGFLLIFLMIFKILSIIERIERDISLLTRRDALDEFEEKRKKNNGSQ